MISGISSNFIENFKTLSPDDSDIESDNDDRDINTMTQNTSNKKQITNTNSSIETKTTKMTPTTTKKSTPTTTKKSPPTTTKKSSPTTTKKSPTTTNPKITNSKISPKSNVDDSDDSDSDESDESEKLNSNSPSYRSNEDSENDSDSEEESNMSSQNMKKSDDESNELVVEGFANSVLNTRSQLHKVLISILIVAVTYLLSHNKSSKALASILPNYMANKEVITSVILFFLIWVIINIF